MDFIQEKEKMQYEFLKKFPRRMKNVGLYAVIIQNSSQKLSWKQYGFTKFDEQINLLFEVLLYIMEQSLKEEKCTMDDIATYIDTINVQYLRKDISYEQCHQLGDFIVNTVLSNEGRPMYFGDMISKKMNMKRCISVMWLTKLSMWRMRSGELHII